MKNSFTHSMVNIVTHNEVSLFKRNSKFRKLTGEQHHAILIAKIIAVEIRLKAEAWEYK